MELGVLNSHVIAHYPLFGRYVVFFREGGVQSFEMALGDLPSPLQNYIARCKQDGKYEVLKSQRCPGMLVYCKRSGENMECFVYSDSYPKNTSMKM